MKHLLIVTAAIMLIAIALPVAAQICGQCDGMPGNEFCSYGTSYFSCKLVPGCGDPNFIGPCKWHCDVAYEDFCRWIPSWPVAGASATNIDGISATDLRVIMDVAAKVLARHMIENDREAFEAKVDAETKPLVGGERLVKIASLYDEMAREVLSREKSSR